MTKLDKLPNPSFHRNPSDFLAYKMQGDTAVYPAFVDIDIACFDGRGVVANSVHNAVQMCLEILGSRLTPFPVAMAITVPSDVISAVLRAGAQPVLLDIEPEYLQTDPKALQEFLTEVPETIVVHYVPPGLKVNPELLDITRENITIGLTSELPYKKTLAKYKKSFTFLVGDYMPLCSAAYIGNVPTLQVSDLKKVRDGVLGLHAMPALEAQRLILEFHMNEQHTKSDFDALYDSVAIEAMDVGDQTPVGKDTPWIAILEVRDAIKLSHILKSEGYECELTLNPLHHTEDLRNRWPEGVPDYPVADSLANSYITIPAIGRGLDDLLYRIEELYDQEKV